MANSAKQVVFLFCSERCGSNLISSIMGNHPLIHSPPPYHLGRNVLLNQHMCIGTDEQSQCQPLIADRFLKSAKKLNSDEAADKLRTWLDTQSAFSATALTQYLYTEFDCKPGSQITFVKENALREVLFFMLQCFPDAKFVFQVRDPRDYLASAKALRGHWLGNKFGSNRNALALWRNDQLAALNAMALLGTERFFFQRYEDLISNPETVLTALSRFLNIDFDTGMLNFHESQAAARLAQGEAARGNITKPLMSDNFGKYRKNLSKGQIRMVETHVGDLMDRFGYERDFPKSKKPNKKDILKAQISEPFEMYLNGQRQPFYSDTAKQYIDKLTENSVALVPDYAAGKRPQAVD